MTEPFDPTEFRQWLFGKLCLVCNEPVTSQGSVFLICVENRISCFLYCPAHRREPTNATETVEAISDRADISIAMMATPEGIANDEEFQRAFAFLREQDPS